MAPLKAREEEHEFVGDGGAGARNPSAGGGSGTRKVRSQLCVSNKEG
jgi:hypothetical protein